MPVPFRKVAHRVIYDEAGHRREVPAYVNAPPRKRQSDFDREREAAEVSTWRS